MSSVGWFSNQLSLPYTANNPDIAIGRHAVAIDECRAFFRTNLWRPSSDLAMAGPKNMKQVWFPGVHCDVGGGYSETESGLAKIALKWMVDEARLAGLMLDEEKVSLMLGERGNGYAAPDPDGCLHDSLTPYWKPFEFMPKPHWEHGKNDLAGESLPTAYVAAQALGARRSMAAAGWPLCRATTAGRNTSQHIADLPID